MRLETQYSNRQKGKLKVHAMVMREEVMREERDWLPKNWRNNKQHEQEGSQLVLNLLSES